MKFIECDLRLRLAVDAEGNVAIVEATVNGSCAESLIRVADAARRIVEPCADRAIYRSDFNAAVQRIRYAAIQKGLIRRAPDGRIYQADFEEWAGLRSERRAPRPDQIRAATLAIRGAANHG